MHNDGVHVEEKRRIRGVGGYRIVNPEDMETEGAMIQEKKR